MTFNYFIQFLYLKTNARPSNKTPSKITVYFISIFTPLHLFVLLLVDRLFLFSLFLFDIIVFP